MDKLCKQTSGKIPRPKGTEWTKTVTNKLLADIPEGTPIMVFMGLSSKTEETRGKEKSFGHEKIAQELCLRIANCTALTLVGFVLALFDKHPIVEEEVVKVRLAETVYNMKNAALAGMKPKGNA